MKINKKLFILTAILTVLPMLFGIFYWEQLPDVMPTHWNMNNEVDGTMPKAMVVYGLPAIMLAVHLLCVFAHKIDPKHQNHSDIMLSLMMWISPAISIMGHYTMYSTALGKSIDVMTTSSLILGIVFTVIGNYLPKCKPNYTIGIKLPWTLDDETNWYKTHRMAGYVWLGAGLTCVMSAVLGASQIVFVVLLIAAIVPTIYSYLLYRKQQKNSE